MTNTKAFDFGAKLAKLWQKIPPKNRTEYWITMIAYLLLMNVGVSMVGVLGWWIARVSFVLLVGHVGIYCYKYLNGDFIEDDPHGRNGFYEYHYPDGRYKW